MMEVTGGIESEREETQVVFTDPYSFRTHQAKHLTQELNKLNCKLCMPH